MFYEDSPGGCVGCDIIEDRSESRGGKGCSEDLERSSSNFLKQCIA